jgi:hypothetical protein
MCFDRNGPTSFLTDSVVSAGMAAANNSGSSVSMTVLGGAEGVSVSERFRFFGRGSQTGVEGV